METWKEILGYGGKYEISDLGNVRSANFRLTGTSKLLRKCRNTCGYPSVTLYSGRGLSDRKTVTVHSLVAAAFIGARQNGIEINHMDGNKENGSVANLEYVSSSENQKHAFRIGLNSHRGERNKYAKLSYEKVEHIRQRAAHGVNTKILAAEFNVHRTAIQRVISGKTWQISQKDGY